MSKRDGKEMPLDMMMACSASSGLDYVFHHIVAYFHTPKKCEATKDDLIFKLSGRGALDGFGSTSDRQQNFGENTGKMPSI